jgi:hypothetical protein
MDQNTAPRKTRRPNAAKGFMTRKTPIIAIKSDASAINKYLPFKNDPKPELD